MKFVVAPEAAAQIVIRVYQVGPARSSNWWQIGELQASCSM